jgi:tight adherence protein C
LRSEEAPVFDPGMLSIAALAFFLAVGVVVFVSVDTVLERRRAHRRIRKMPEAEMGPKEARERQLAQPIHKRAILPGLSRLGRRLRQLAPAEQLERMDQILQHAGSPPRWDAERLLAAKAVTAAALFLITVLFGMLLGASLFRVSLMAAIFAFLGYLLPGTLLRSRAQERQAAIQRALPDALDLLSISVRAGLGFDAAVDRVAREVGGPLAEELRRMLREMQLGRSRQEALRHLGERNPVPELESFVLAMIQADIFGVAISRVLEAQSREMRIRRRQRAEEKAQKVPVKILFPVVFCIFPALFVVILGPAAIQLYRTFVAS